MFFVRTSLSLPALLVCLSFVFVAIYNINNNEDNKHNMNVVYRIITPRTNVYSDKIINTTDVKTMTITRKWKRKMKKKIKEKA